MAFDAEGWQRSIFEALRPIDPPASFNVGLAEMDFRNLGDARFEDFPVTELVEFVDNWLAGVDPDGGEVSVEWEGGGVRLRFRAKGRAPSWRGAGDIPSFNLLEPEIGVLHFVDGGERRLIDLTLEELDALGCGEKRVVGQGQSYQGTFEAIAHEMRHFGLGTVAELNPTAITTHAAMLGLGPSLPRMGNFDATWREMNRIPPDD
jgi:hypothetical protein